MPSALGTRLGAKLGARLGQTATRGLDRTLYGVRPASVADFYTTAAGMKSPGTNLAFFLAVMMRVETQALASQTRLFASTLNTPTVGGFYFQTLATHSSAWFVPVNAGGSGTASPSQPITAADVGKVLLVMGVVDGAALKARLFAKNAQVSAGTNITSGSYSPSATVLNLLRDPRGTLWADGITVFGATWGAAVPTLAEYQACQAACQAAGDIVAIPGKSAGLVSVKRDVAGASAPVQLTDRIGTDHMTRQGAPQLVVVPQGGVWA